MESLTRQRMIENITMLWTLNEVPEPPKENAIDCSANETRQLTPARERQLVDNLAFISASTDDMLRVMAVCIEERSDQQGMTIRLASNTGDLSPTVKSFEVIACTLERAALRVDSRVSVRQDLFRQILVLDERRILSRLRSRHAARTRKTAGKPAVVDLLSRSINDPSIRSGKTTKANLKRVRSKSDQMSKTFTTFKATYNSDAAPNVSLDTLADLLRYAFEFDTKSLQMAFDTTTAINPSTKSFLPEAINKLGRYYSIANDLVDAARSSRYTIFRRISVEALEEPTIDVASITDGLLGFEAVLKRNIGLLYQQGDWQRRSQSLKAARTKFELRIWNCATPWKIHAEIQLLFFYEQNPSIPHPRTIGSSKNACYLCDLFIRFHGKFHTPRTHGKLYDKWLLPEWTPDQPDPSPRLLSAFERFDASLKARIVQSLHDRRSAYPQPNESSLPFRELWSSVSTLAQAVTPQLGPDSSDSIPHKVPNEAIGPPSNTLVCTTHGPPADCALETTTSTNRTTDVIVDAESQTHERIAPADTPSFAVRPLSRGHRVGYEWSTPASTLIVRTEAINLHISWDWESTTCHLDHDMASSTRWIEVEWLAPGKPVANGNEDSEFISVGMLDNETDNVIESVSASDLRPLIFENGGHTVLLQRHYRGPLPV